MRRHTPGSWGTRRSLAATFLAAAGIAAGGLSASAATSFPNDYFFAAGDQWGLRGAPASINAAVAWCVSTGASVLVADVDSGADFQHPDLRGKLVAGARFTSGAGNAATPDGTGAAAVQDDLGHGTMTTGIMVANTNNSEGIAAVAPDARALIVKVLDSSGRGSSGDVAAGIQWAVDHGARVINLSIGSDVQNLALANLDTSIPNAIDYAAQHNVAVAVAAGNNSVPVTDYAITTRMMQEALIVGAVGPDGSVASYSSSGSGVNIYGPGGAGNGTDVHTLIVSTYPTSSGHPYEAGAGTSFATPHVAGVLAQLLAAGYSAQAAHDRILATAVQRGGVPQVDAGAALGATQTCGVAGAAPAPTSGGVPVAPGHGGTPPRATPAPRASPPAPGPSPAPTAVGPSLTVASPTPSTFALLPASASPRTPRVADVAGVPRAPGISPAVLVGVPLAVVVGIAAAVAYRRRART